MSKGIENEDIGNRIMALRLQHGYTREVLAERLNITWQHLANIEKGRRRVTIDILAGLYEHLHISSNYILYGVSATEKGQELASIIDAADPEIYPCLESAILSVIKANEVGKERGAN